MKIFKNCLLCLLFGIQAKEELTNLLSEPELSETVFLVLANKRDLPGALSVAEVSYFSKFPNIQCPQMNCINMDGQASSFLG